MSRLTEAHSFGAAYQDWVYYGRTTSIQRAPALLWVHGWSLTQIESAFAHQPIDRVVSRQEPFGGTYYGSC